MARPKQSSLSSSVAFLRPPLRKPQPVCTITFFLARVWPIQLEGSVLNTEHKEIKENAPKPVQGEAANHKQETDGVESKCTSPGQKCVSTHANKNQQTKQKSKRTEPRPKHKQPHNNCHLWGNSFLRRTQFWVRKTFSKPASLKRASLVALPAATSRNKPQSFIETKTLRFCNLDTTNFKK